MRRSEKSGLRVLSEITRDVGQVFLGSAVVGPLFIKEADKNWGVITFGVITAISAWIFSYHFGKRGNI